MSSSLGKGTGPSILRRRPLSSCWKRFRCSVSTSGALQHLPTVISGFWCCTRVTLVHGRPIQTGELISVSNTHLTSSIGNSGALQHLLAGASTLMIQCLNQAKFVRNSEALMHAGEHRHSLDVLSPHAPTSTCYRYLQGCAALQMCDDCYEVCRPVDKIALDSLALDRACNLVAEDAPCVALHAVDPAHACTVVKMSASLLHAMIILASSTGHAAPFRCPVLDLHKHQQPLFNDQVSSVKCHPMTHRYTLLHMLHQAAATSTLMGPECCRY